VFLADIDQVELPIAHAEGKFLVRDDAALALLAGRGQLALRYATADGLVDNVPYPANPNGATSNVAGVTDLSGHVLGLMPHPERFIFREQHPNWTRGHDASPPWGRQIFASAVRYFS
jgi:phosphoribosylformylglycinamidine synthase